MSKLIIGQVNYSLVRPLQGRGQPGLAGFYQIDSSSPLALIKQDDAATCLAEGLAIQYTPPKMSSVNSCIFASAGVAQINGVNTTISIQGAFVANTNEKLVPFADIALGRKRDPSAWLSDEFKNEKQIKQVIEGMSANVKYQLAHAIYTSQLNGDESLHTGQFVCSVDANNKISKIQRIDFGALGRYSVARTDYDVTKTSKLYAKSGQLGKDYVSYLLQNPEVKNHVLNLWAHTNVKDVKESVGKRFDEQIENITDSTLKAEALSGFHSTLTKKSKTVPNSGDLKLIVKETLVQSTEQRCLEMRASAQLIILEEYLSEMKKGVAPRDINHPDVKRLSEGLANNKDASPVTRLKALDLSSEKSIVVMALKSRLESFDRSSSMNIASKTVVDTENEFSLSRGRSNSFISRSESPAVSEKISNFNSYKSRFQAKLPHEKPKDLIEDLENDNSFTPER